MAGLSNQLFWICMCLAVGLHSANARESSWWDYVVPVAAGGVAIVGAPFAVAAVGFGTGGIIAGSLGAKMMSVAAIANGGGVATGSIVAGLQSIGAAGLSTSASAALGTGVGAATAGIRKLVKKDSDNC